MADPQDDGDQDHRDRQGNNRDQHPSHESESSPRLIAARPLSSGTAGATARSGRPWFGGTAGRPSSANGTGAATPGSPSGRAWCSTRSSRPPRSHGRGITSPGPPSRQGGRTSRGDRRKPAALATERRPAPCHRCHEFLPDPADGPADPALGRRSLRFLRRPKDNIDRNPPEFRRVRPDARPERAPDGLPVAGVAGDQQASLVGQGCLASSSSRPNSRSAPLGAIPPGGRPPSDAGDTPSRPSSMTIAPSPDPSRGSADSPGAVSQGRRSCWTSAMPRIGARDEKIATPHRKTSEEATPLQRHWRNRVFPGVENNQGSWAQIGGRLDLVATTSP